MFAALSPATSSSPSPITTITREKDHPFYDKSTFCTMTASILYTSTPLSEPTIIISPAMTEHDSGRGRKRDRSNSPRSNIRSVRAAPSDESSTLRGRSRHRATSPWGQPSRASSPSIKSPTTKRLLHVRLRREHCPSRVATPASEQRTFRRRQRTRSRSCGPRLELEPETIRLADVVSSLRNQVLAEHQEQDEPEEET